MATKKKDTSKKMTDTVDIPRGITARKTSTGLTTFKVSIGTGPRRRVATFDRLDEAVAFRAMWTDVESERRRLGLQSLTKQEFLGQVAAPRLVIGTAGPQVEPLPIMKMIDELSAIMADSRKDPGSLDRDVKIFKRFIADTMAPSPVWTTESWKDATWTITSGSCSLDLCEHLDDSDRARVVAHYKSEAAAADERVKTVVALSDQVTVKIAGQFPRWLSRQNYATATAESILDFADRLWTKAVAHGHVHVNVFVQLKMSARDLARYNRKGHDRNAQTADAHTATQILTIAQLLRPTYLLAFWICVILGTRKSEPFGLRIGDWQPETGDLYLEHQRQGSPKRGRSSLKRPESKRPVPVPHQIATALNEYIRNTHGVDPENKVALEGVKDRYLIVGAKGGPMDPNSFARAVKDAALAGGIDPQTVGTFKPVHHLRKTLGALLQSNRSLSGRAISILLGHKVHDTVEINTTARVTDKHYNPTIASELRAVVAAIEDWIDGEVLASMGNTDLLHFGEIVDPMSVDDAAARLSEGGSDWTSDDVLKLVQTGEVRCSRLNFTNEEHKQRPVVSESDVQRVLASQMRVNLETYSGADVVEILRLDRSTVYDMAAQGCITEVTTDSRRRIGARGNEFGSLPGGGRRFLKDDVDRLANQDPNRSWRIRHWVKIGEVAELLEISADTVRSWQDRGDLISWRDPLSARHERYTCPESVQVQMENRRTVTIAEAAIELRISRAKVGGLVKTGFLAAGPKRGTVLCSSVELYRASRSGSA